MIVLAIAQYTMIAHSKRIMQFAGPTRLRSVCVNMVSDADVTVVKFNKLTASDTTMRGVRYGLKTRVNVKTVDMGAIASLQTIIAYTWIQPFMNNVDELLFRNGFNLLVRTNTSKVFYNEIFPDPMYDACEVLMSCMVAFAVNDTQHANLFACKEGTFHECMFTNGQNISSKYTIIEDTDTSFRVCFHEMIHTFHGVVPALNRFYRWSLRKKDDTWMIRTASFFCCSVEAKCSECSF